MVLKIFCEWKAKRHCFLERKQIRVDVLDHWESQETDAKYPSRWRLRIDSPDVDLSISARLADQEMITLQSSGVIYWEGSVSFDGQSGGRNVNGTGYVELTGYAEPFSSPM